MSDPRLPAIPDIHGHAKGEHKAFVDERPIPYHARLIFLWFYHAAARRSPRFVMISDHVNYLTFEDPAAVSLVRRALKLALAGDLYGASETAKVDMHHAKVVSEAMRAGMRFSIGAEMDNDPRSRPDAQNVIDAMKPDGIIRSIHFLPIKHPDTGDEWMWPFDNPEFKHFYERVGVEETWQLYADLMVDAVKNLPGDILGHLHVPGKFGHWPAEESTLEAIEDRILDACAERGMGIEINTRVFYRATDPAVHTRHLELYRRLLKKCVERDLPIAIGSDAHSPRDQGAGIDRILPLLDEADINEIVFPINGTLARVALRADRPIKSRPSVVIQPARQPIVSEQDAESAAETPALAEPSAAGDAAASVAARSVAAVSNQVAAAASAGAAAKPTAAPAPAAAKPAVAPSSSVSNAVPALEFAVAESLAADVATSGVAEQPPITASPAPAPAPGPTAEPATLEGVALPETLTSAQAVEPSMPEAAPARDLVKQPASSEAAAPAATASTKKAKSTVKAAQKPPSIAKVPPATASTAKADAASVPAAKAVVAKAPDTNPSDAKSAAAKSSAQKAAPKKTTPVKAAAAVAKTPPAKPAAKPAAKKSAAKAVVTKPAPPKQAGTKKPAVKKKPAGKR